ncbi:MAG: hypothetical protein AAFS10_04795 [Myxococcota bacterium]
MDVQSTPTSAALAPTDDVLQALASCAPTRALTLLEQLKHHPDRADLWMELARVLDRNGLWGQAALAALHAHARSPYDPELVLDVALMLVWNRRDQEALALVQPLLHASDAESRWTALEVQLAVYVRGGDWTLAQATCELLLECASEVASEDGAPYQARLPLLALASRGELKGTLFELAEEPSLGTPVDAALFEGLARGLKASGERLASIWALDEALLERDDVLLSRQLDTWAAELGIRPETAGERCAAQALAWFRTKIIDEPQAVPAWVALAGIALDLGLDDEAEQAAREALRLAPHMPQAHSVLAEVMATRGAVEDAETHLHEAVHHARHPSSLYVELARLYHHRMERPEAALAACRQALQHEPMCVPALAHMEHLYDMQGDRVGQLQVLATWIEGEVDDRLLEGLYLRKSEVLKQLGREAQAAQARTQAVACREGDPSAERWDEDDNGIATRSEPPALGRLLLVLGVVGVAVGVMLLRWWMG